MVRLKVPTEKEESTEVLERISISLEESNMVKSKLFKKFKSKFINLSNKSKKIFNIKGVVTEVKDEGIVKVKGEDKIKREL